MNERSSFTSIPPPPDQPARDRILQELGTNILVEAAAGTGKTTSMVGRMVALLRQGRCGVDQIAAVTFTKKAASELRGRFQIALEKAIHGAGPVEEQTRLLHALSRIEQCFIGTIHSFCGRLLRERPVEAGVDVAFRECDDAEDAVLRGEAWDAAVGELYVTESPLLNELAEVGLDIEQLTDGFLRFALYPDVDEWPSQRTPLPDIHAVREALESYLLHMRALTPALDSQCGCPLVKKYFRIPRIVDQFDLNDVIQLTQALEHFEGNVEYQKTKWPGGRKDTELADAEMARWKSFVICWVQPILSAWREQRYDVTLRIYGHAVERYNRLRTDHGIVNFQDLLIKSAALLRNHPHIRQYFARRYTHLLIDEFQDTDPVQAEVMMLLTAADYAETDWRHCCPRPGSLFVVGDPKQSIYRFRRADIVTYNQVRDIIQNTGGHILTLSANFRTIPPIIDWVNQCFIDDFAQYGAEYMPQYCALEPGKRAATDDSDTLAPIQILPVPSPPKGVRIKEDLVRQGDAASVAERIRQSIADGLQPEDFMIVTRKRKNLSLYGQALQSMGIPHQVTGGGALSENAPLKLLHQLLEAVTHPDNPVALVATLRGPIFGFSDADLFRFVRSGGRFRFLSSLPGDLPDDLREIFSGAFDQLRASYRHLMANPIVAAVEWIIDEMGLLARAAHDLGGNSQAGCLLKGIEVLRAAQDDLSTTREVVERLGQIVDPDLNDETYDGLPARPMGSAAVRIMNLHKVKGLEAPVVFLANPTGKSKMDVDCHVDRAGARRLGYMRIAEPTGPNSKKLLAHPLGWDGISQVEATFLAAEESRLLYVAATRAGRQLTVSSRSSYRNYNPWDFFDEFLNDAVSIKWVDAIEATKRDRPVLSPDLMTDETERLAQNRATGLAPTYTIVAGKAMAISMRAPVVDQFETTSDINETGGAPWGNVIHALLEAAMRSPVSDWAALAPEFLKDEELDADLAGEAVETVQAVMRSDIWRRARASKTCLPEAPFQICWNTGDDVFEGDDSLSSGRPVVVRGVIDLVFRESGGWVIVDYKSDRSPREGLDRLIDHYRPQLELYARAWGEATGEPVLETGLYFTRVNRYCPL